MADEDGFAKAGRFFSKLGGKLKEVGTVVGEQVVEKGQIVGKQVVATSKQVTGLGRGEVRLEIPNPKAAPGGAFTGKLVLALKEPVEGKRAIVSLQAHQRRMTMKDGTAGSSYVPVYNFDRELAPSGTFAEGQTFDFELTVPTDALELRPKESAGANPLVDVARTIASAVTPNVGPIEWRIVGRLEIAWGRDLSTNVDVIVAQ